MPDHVTTASLDWALAHTIRYGDTDIFPVPFEYQIIKAHWTYLRDHLAAVDLETHELASATKLMVPKAGGGYRAATQLDPLDSLLLSASLYEAAPQIESYRMGRAERIACAFRVESDTSGKLFSDDSGWKDYHDKTAELISSRRFRYVLCADISDYYNQASHHRIQGALSAAGVPEGRSKNLEQFLSRLNALHHSKGIPVGPTAGILLGEACLADVDVKLSRRHTHVRYVDDFRIFCETLDQADHAFHELAEYLFTAHRLSLHPTKTRILDVDTFAGEELFDPEQSALETKRDRISNILKRLVGDDYNDIDESAFDTSYLDKDILRELFLRATGESILNQSLARYALRKAAALRSRVFIGDVIANLEKLAPVYRDTVRFLLKVGDRKRPKEIGDALVAIAKTSRIGFLPFIQIWTLQAFCEQPALCTAGDALKIAEASHPNIRDRLSALVAKSYGMTDWIRERKESWNSHGPWGHRAILWAASALPHEERRHWLKSAQGHPLVLTRSVAKIAAST
jgi:hypothetical protein